MSLGTSQTYKPNKTYYNENLNLATVTKYYTCLKNYNKANNIYFKKIRDPPKDQSQRWTNRRAQYDRHNRCNTNGAQQVNTNDTKFEI